LDQLPSITSPGPGRIIEGFLKKRNDFEEKKEFLSMMERILQTLDEGMKRGFVDYLCIISG
jgi:hypothetical protein